eukprot:CAMPEP_0119310644 /NCGR_PEP_ID=MMETSP1333-20130426/19689_1 /TAXON_ID=418940 /ORGANISM="Scyphosphaera apsteinii, Strain RCC1455" /LENGTH=76 /DNA_ID=CAMNT_0007314863 /DNA_START=44 /DNA_END=277 /DNA_ORIENTATION=-
MPLVNYAHEKAKRVEREEAIRANPPAAVSINFAKFDRDQLEPILDRYAGIDALSAVYVLQTGMGSNAAADTDLCQP